MQTNWGGGQGRRAHGPTRSPPPTGGEPPGSRLAWGWGGVGSASDPAEAKVEYLHGHSNPRAAVRVPSLSRVGTHSRQLSESTKYKKKSMRVGRETSTRLKGTRRKGREKGAQPGRGAGGLHHCSSPSRKWAPNRGDHHGARVGPRFPRAFPERSGRGH